MKKSIFLTVFAAFAGIASAHAQLIEQLEASNYDPTTGVITATVGSNATAFNLADAPTLVTGATLNGSSAISFSGDANNYFNFTTAIPIESGYTVLAYILPAATQLGAGSTGVILGDQGAYGLSYRIDSNLTQEALVQSVTSLGSSATPLSSSSFSSIGVSVSGSGGIFALNGVVDGGTNSNGLPFTNTIGKFGSDEYSENITGQIAELDIYNGALTSAQIIFDENALTAKYTAAVVPEPSTMALMLAGGLAMAGFTFCRRRLV